MPNLYLEGITISEIEALIKKAVEEVWNNKVELEGKNNLQPWNNIQLSDKSLLSRKETAALLRISLPTLSDWTKKGLIKSYCIGRKVFYKDNEVNSALAEIKPKYKKE